MTTELEQKVDALSIEEKKVLEALCFSIRWHSATSLHKWFYKSAIVKENNIPFKTSDVGPQLTRLNNKDFTVIRNNQYHTVKEEYVIPLFTLFNKKPNNFSKLYKGFKEQNPPIKEPFYWVLEDSVVNTYSILNQALLLEDNIVAAKTINDLKVTTEMNSNATIKQVLIDNNEIIIARLIQLDKLKDVDELWLQDAIDAIIERSFIQGYTNKRIIEALTKSTKEYPELDLYRAYHSFLQGDFTTVLSLTTTNRKVEPQLLNLFALFE